MYIADDLTFRYNTHLFVKVPRPGDSDVNFSVFRVKLPPVTISLNHTKVEAIPLSALPKDTTSELVGLSSH